MSLNNMSLGFTPIADDLTRTLREARGSVGVMDSLSRAMTGLGQISEKNSIMAALDATKVFNPKASLIDAIGSSKILGYKDSFVDAINASKFGIKDLYPSSAMFDESLGVKSLMLDSLKDDLSLHGAFVDKLKSLDDHVRPFKGIDTFLGDERRLQRSLGLTFEHQRLCERLVTEPALPQFFVKKKPSPPPPAQWTIRFESRCFLCSSPMICADSEVESIGDHQLIGRLSVAPCAACIRCILENPNYLLERVADIANCTPRPPALALLDGGREGDGVARGSLSVVTDDPER